MSQRFQMLFTTIDIGFDKSHYGSFNGSQNRTFTTLAGQAFNAKCRFVLPRSAVAGKGVRLVSVSLLYRIVTGSASSMIAALTKYTYVDGAIENAASIPVTTPTFVTTNSTTINRIVSTVTSPAYETSGSNESINWLYNVLITPNNTGDTMLFHGFEVIYDADVSGSSAANNGGTPATSNFTADFARSGFTYNINSASGSIIATLPDLTVDAIGATFTFKSSSESTNSIQISPGTLDSIRGLNLNGSGDPNKDYILATPATNNYITITAGVFDTNRIWYVTSAGGTWSREV